MNRLHIPAILAWISLCTVATTYSGSFKERELLRDMHINVSAADDWIDKLNARGALAQPRDASVLPTPYRMIPLFKQYPELQKNLPYISLGDLPTPIHRLEKLSALVGAPHLYIKRDDVSGAKSFDTGHIYGGNKVRKLEFLLAEALAHGAQTVITFGAAGSNHALATSIYAQQLGLKAICMLMPQACSYGVRNNLLMHVKHNTQLEHYLDGNMRKIGTICAWLHEYHEHGSFPYIIPTGGSSALGAVGFVNAAFELKEQITAGGLPEPDLIYVPCGSMGTAAGLVLGCKAAGLSSRIVAILVEPVHEDQCIKKFKKLFDATVELLRTLDASFPAYTLLYDDIIFNYNFYGPRYAVFTPEGMQARALVKETENITLDGTYTAKACAALLDDIRKGSTAHKVVLFWDTYCGIDYSQYLTLVKYDQLPWCFYDYFEHEVQALDQMLPDLSAQVQKTSQEILSS